MTRDEIMQKLATLPQGGITSKVIKVKGKEYKYFFLQWTENGKQVAKRLKDDELGIVSKQIEERKNLEHLLDSMGFIDRNLNKFNTQVRFGEILKKYVNSVHNWKRRSGYKCLEDYIYGDEYNKVFIMYGLRRTGKTTLIKQIIDDMSPAAFDKTAHIQITRADDLGKLNKDLRWLERNGFKYIFIDEATLMHDFIDGAALLSDIYAAEGMKIVLSGTDSLGFWLAKSDELYDRCILFHSTFIPYKEFEGVLGIKGIDNYIQYGGTMCMSGSLYNNGIFSDKVSTNEYVDSFIAQNIQHSLNCYQYGGHFRHLYTLYEKKELTGAINRVVEDINHRFLLEVLERDFKSSDLMISQKNLRKDKNNPTTILDDIDVESFTKRLKERLEIKNKDEREVEIDEGHIIEIQEYLLLLDLIQEIDVLDIDYVKDNLKRVVFSQPGLRYSQAKSFIDSLSNDVIYKNLDIEEKKRVEQRILNEIKGRMMEDIVLLETKLAKKDKKVFKLEFADGEFDMVIADDNAMTCEIYEVKHSTERVSEQYKHLVDVEKCKKTEHRFGKITGKYVLYRGENYIDGDIQYLNVEDYLKKL